MRIFLSFPAPINEYLYTRPVLPVGPNHYPPNLTINRAVVVRFKTFIIT